MTRLKSTIHEHLSLRSGSGLYFPPMCRVLILSLLLAYPSVAQWQMQQSQTDADLHAVDYAGGKIAWAAGSEGTVMRTEDRGTTWHVCATPPGAEHLDFRGIQAVGEEGAIIMSTGIGKLSRLYVTVDRCSTWKLLLTNAEESGSWATLALGPAPRYLGQEGVLIGNPVRGRFDDYLVDFRSAKNWWLRPWARKEENLLPESSSSLFFLYSEKPFWFVTGGKGGARVIKRVVHHSGEFMYDTFEKTRVPVGDGTTYAGGASIVFKTRRGPSGYGLVLTDVGVVVGGDSAAPNRSEATAAFTQDGGKHWLPAQSFPHGYRSCVAYDRIHDAWIAVGPTGTDVSFDDGRNWHALEQQPQQLRGPAEAEGWTALSLPFAVGQHGRIGLLSSSALTLQVAKPSNKSALSSTK